MNSESVAQDQLRAFVERVLRMREEAKAIKDDIREIYAEAKGNGFDKTALGKLVLYVEKRGKDGAALAEQDALFDLYLDAFDGGPSHAHAHEAVIVGEFTVAIPPHDADGVIIETSFPAGETTQEANPGLPVSRGEETEDRQPRSEPGIADDRMPAGEDHNPAGLEPAPITYERTPEQPIRWHAYCTAWPTGGPADHAALVEDVRVNAVREPIVRIGFEIVDGRRRYLAAREAGIRYPVQQYQGDDLLTDVIQWNLASRPGLSAKELRSVAEKLIKAAPDRAEEIPSLLGLHLEEAAA
jgi:uncharacterized protein (UPF0335 family)